MKFLCTSCDTQMKLIDKEKTLAPDDKGSLSIQYECPECLMAIGMLTNAFETQLVTSLGVEIGGKTVDSNESKCPFSAMARDAMETSDDEEVTEPAYRTSDIAWTAQAMVRLQRIPDFVREQAKKGIEKFAMDQGYTQVNEKCLDEAKDHFNM